MSNRKNVQKKTTAFGEPSSEPTKTRASANVAAKPVKRNSASGQKISKLEVQARAGLGVKSKKQSERVNKEKSVVGVVNERRGEIPKLLYENYQSPPFNRFYILAFALGVFISVGGYFGWQYTTEKVTEKIEVVAESPRIHSWIDKVTNTNSRKIMRLKNTKVKKSKRNAARQRSR